MGKVTRTPQVEPAAPSPTGAAPLPKTLDMLQINRTIRSNLTAVKVCYLRQQRSGPRSGIYNRGNLFQARLHSGGDQRRVS